MKSNSRFPFSPARDAPPATNEQIAALAHAIWLDRGCPIGHDIDHWLEAERQLRGDVVMDDRALERLVSPPSPRNPTSL